ncbi:MAG: epoxyqueuosine reductase QueH [Thermodesulfobacteriota bacterium]|nr:epoxyqueuosine reductase QueH [Thermodesulfobacteriota bacterium]
MSEDKRICLHTCCGPCASAPVERLIAQGYEIIMFFSNSNIYPRKEYDKRLDNARRVAETFKVRIEEDVYDHASWLDHIKGMEDEPEHGRRCPKCFEYNLERTSKFTKNKGIEAFTTTLTVSPHKPSKLIFTIGDSFPGFVPMDFKKKDGFKKSVYLSKQMGLYRQRYCGCEFSMAKP